jgi:glucose dehydrogenase
LGGGGTAWDSFAYDPQLDLLYVGTGNGSPWNQAVRSPGGGDNSVSLFDPRAASRHRKVRLALPNDAGRLLGLHRDAAQ